MTKRTGIITFAALGMLLIIIVAFGVVFSLSKGEGKVQPKTTLDTTETTQEEKPPHWVKPPITTSIDNTANTQPVVPDVELDSELFTMFISDGAYSEGSNNVKLTIDQKGKWAIANISHGPVDEEIATVISQGTISKTQLASFQQVIESDAEKLRNDESLKVLCKPESADAPRINLTYFTRSDVVVDFDKCWVGAHQELDLIVTTGEIVAPLFDGLDLGL